eukprot:NODE_2247_length_2258_cov_14.192867.p1 GENE.NODE_2247_length_2258_cov_14.192867~~NODE_2247_length_2258_cov_14.192867.p1  ORF type:complete len:547 (+),score=146.60 NODE_2247_length_2258_cov_14.192867:516-2156(+)
MLCTLKNDGGQLVFHPSFNEEDDVAIPLTRGKLVVFRADTMEYSYEPNGQSAALQSWTIEPSHMHDDFIVQNSEIKGPAEPLGERVNVMGIAPRSPGYGFSQDAAWCMYEAGSDCTLVVPIIRWDIDVYYKDEHTLGFSTTKHGNFLQTHELADFDCAFFGMTEYEVSITAPYQRLCLEVGYQALYNGGRRREDLLNLRCGIFMGDSGSEWDYLRQLKFGSEIFTDPLLLATGSAQNYILASRISHTFNLKGPVFTADTACSSSLVAMGVAKMHMRRLDVDQSKTILSDAIRESVVIGCNTILGAMAYISLSGPGLLTSRGRCFTFDHSADGYARSEGSNAVYFYNALEAGEASGRWAAVIGAAINQDGRSAAMTAPHGPSQQEVIAASMREGFLEAGDITIAECHGTGTALGDPIEVGALRGVMERTGEVIEPLLLTSSKSNLGHGEAAAGMNGVVKCILLLNHSTGCPNVHLRELNPHFDTESFPIHWLTEACDWMLNSGITGVSSFGFGGTNARADVWGNATVGARKCITSSTTNTNLQMLRY